MSRTRRTRLVLAAAAALLGGCSSTPEPAPRPSPTPSPSPRFDAPPVAVATNPGPFRAGPVVAPTTGAYLGAWARPQELTQEGRLAAIGELEEDLGRPLDIVNTYRRFDEPAGTESDHEFVAQGVTLMISWASADTRAVVSGQHDKLIRAQAQRVRAIRAPVLLRFRWEMDRPNLRATMWSPADYIAAWRHVRAIFAAERVGNVSWVWCPTAEGFVRGDAPAFYPGDDAVDWTCVDVYAGNVFRPLGELMGPFLTWAAQRPKPIVVGEFGVARAWGPDGRAAWLRDAARVFKANPQIKAVAYFESDPDGNGPRQQFQLSDDRTAMKAFTELTRDPYFRPRRPPR
ncbi:MAG TPA: glycosyl hydrolase [Catenuloplanes sp.]